MAGRIGTVCSELSKTRVFADVGCDHGFMAQYMLKNGLCERAYISDVSAKSLNKAEKLLSREIENGSCIPVVADGLKGLPERCDLLLIAGLGGREIVRILDESYLPDRFVFQPMKNPEDLRAYLVSKGASIEKDYTFGSGYFYELIKGAGRGGCEYSEKELLWGKDNLRSPQAPFFEKTKAEQEKVRSYLSRGGLSENSRKELEMRLEALDEVIYEIKNRL